MSKNTSSTKFRKVDVDAYNEDNFHDEDVEEETQGPNEGEVQSLLAKSRNLDALKLVLTNPPVATKNQATKDRALQCVMRILLSFKSAEVENAVKSLDATQSDVLMKYIYRGFECPSDGSSAQLLTWHEQTFKVAGLGSIIRVLTDRKRV